MCYIKSGALNCQMLRARLITCSQKQKTGAGGIPLNFQSYLTFYDVTKKHYMPTIRIFYIQFLMNPTSSDKRGGFHNEKFL